MTFITILCHTWTGGTCPGAVCVLFGAKPSSAGRGRAAGEAEAPQVTLYRCHAAALRATALFEPTTPQFVTAVTMIS
ncbi:hypothetical protein RR48_10384 [Papilio machaon]|uniref:Uncharacterized protein n=1 Tax=Papilio machaon TaxID=76193 RepID=A0A194RHI6_PAPMA|nr:hypothetical protein RR48_10384 [Papilio machaon]